ncbi:putative oxidoreductase [Ectocarpus siliculosus]|uniref:Oxidoreductase n=1 Tax=Ectocarpus siliculosus TaxID=2880 RepID=D7G0Y4_ECTSI|nr:putative oxidoreductase [Ectocarpus siliculosus]|eukprot:CBJ26728.1 putative oxidoreductase [Ectocarpus siliculosus]
MFSVFPRRYPWPKDQPPNNALQGPNIWPDSDSLGEDWRDSMSALFRLMVSVNEAVARGLSLSLDLGLQDLPALCQGGDTISLLRLFHYFPYSNDAASNSNSSGGGSGGGSGTGSGNRKDDDDGSAKAVASTGSGTGEENCGNDDTGNSGGSSGSQEGSGAGNIGSSPHTDWGLSTSILQDGAGGLQFLEQATQRWVDVPCAQEDALVFNCGDYLSLLSNGRLKSPVHQVVTTGVERTSVVFFYYSIPASTPSYPSPLRATTRVPAQEQPQQTRQRRRLQRQRQPRRSQSRASRGRRSGRTTPCWTSAISSGVATLQRQQP